MYPQSCDGWSTRSTCLDLEPPLNSRLARSLKRGHFASTFGEWSVIGRGGYGTVVKAWHIEDRRWYAVKLISARVRADETIENAYEAWCGQEVFNQLRGLRSPYVVKYVRYWSEVPGDVPCQSVPSPVPSPKLNVAAPPIPAGSDTVSDSPSLVLSDGGFEWATPSPKSGGDSSGAPEGGDAFEDNLESFVRGSSISPKNMYYKVTILEQMEYCEGVTLATWLERPGLRPGLSSSASPAGILELFAQIVRGLADIHSAGIVHCDVKPSNILITSPGAQVKFFDFGTAKMRATAPQRQVSRTPLSADDQEGARTALGTPGYAPPEHCFFRSSAPRPRSLSDDSLLSEPVHSKLAGSGADIFSAGVILVELLMAMAMKGAAWLTAMEKAKALAQVRNGVGGGLPAAVLQAPGVDGWLRQLVRRMVVWDAEVRPTALEVLDELEVGLWVFSRRSPHVGSRNPHRPELAAMLWPPAATHNPYIGYFLDHRRRPERQ